MYGSSRMYGSTIGDRFRVEVKHRCPAPDRYTWEIFCEHEVLPVDKSCERFGSWEEASRFGKKALEKLSALRT